MFDVLTAFALFVILYIPVYLLPARSQAPKYHTDSELS